MHVEKLPAIAICVVLVVSAQALAVAAFEAWFKGEAGESASVPQSTVQLITLVVSFGLGWLILKIWPDE